MVSRIKQEHLIKLNFRRGDLVRFVVPVFDGSGIPRTTLVNGQVECACSAREGWYYVREQLGEIHLVLWSDLDPISE